MPDLTKKQESFIELMKKSDEHAFRGFDLLAKREDADRFFSAVKAAGLLEPERNPAPVPVEPAGSVRIPSWPALGYLVACATIADKRNDEALAQEVMKVVRSATRFKEPGTGGIRDNYHTFRVFAEILGILPPSAVSNEDVELVPTWLSSRFDSDTVAHALDAGPIKRFLASEDKQNWNKAAEIVRHCLAFRWEAQKARALNEEEPVTLVDAYWLKELINNHAADLGKKVGKEAATIFRDAVAQLFGKGRRASWSYLYRPAVEEHSQNHSWKTAENAFVEGLRDVLLSWSEAEPAEARAFISEMLRHDVEMVRRVGIFLVNERWRVLRALYSEMLQPTFFQIGHIHELYGLLAMRFEGLTIPEKEATLDVIRRIPEREGEDAKNRLKRSQRRWLEAISSTKFEAATEWLKELSADPNIGVPEHPDFNSYMETGWGPGRSPFELQELVALAEQGGLGASLKGFVPTDAWKAPTAEALADTLERAVIAAPKSFVAVLPSLLDVEVEYQTAIVTGFKRLWEDKEQTLGGPTVDWGAMWPALFTYLETIFENPEAGAKPGPQSWLLSVVADLLRAGTLSDERAYPAELLPRGWDLLKRLIARAEATQGPADDDPMTAAINSPRGHVIEAAVNHALRVCRLADKETGAHRAAWGQLRELFDAELQKTRDNSYEFATLLGAYLANFDYLDTPWVSNNLLSIFPVGKPQFLAAIGGLAYAPATDRIYGMLRDAGIIDAALSAETKGRESRQKLIERITIAYLRGEDNLARFSFDHARAEDLQHAAWFMWSLRGETLNEAQRTRTLEFFDRSVTWAQAQASPPGELLSSLAGLAWVLSDADGRRRELLLAVAPYVKRNHRTHDFLVELARLIEVSRDGVAEVLERLVETHPEPFYDYQDRLKAVIKRLFELGDRPRALAFCDRLRNVNGMLDLFGELRARA
jgi:hypothetical protein